MLMNNILTHSFGKSFPASFIMTGYIFMIVGIIILFKVIIVGVIVLLIGAFIAFVNSGVQINIADRGYRTYDSFLGIKKGKWLSIDKYSYITLMRKKESSATLSRSNRRAVTSSDVQFDICLLNENHSKTRPIKRLKNEKNGLEDLNELSKQLNLPKAEYKPPISNKTKARKAYRR